MMYLRIQENHNAGELVPIKDDAIFVYCDVCNSCKQLKDVSHGAFGVCSFEQLNSCEECSQVIWEKREQEAIRKALGWDPYRPRKIKIIK